MRNLQSDAPRPTRRVLPTLSRAAGMLLPAAIVALTMLVRRPATAPVAGGLDSSIEIFYAWYQHLHGLELRGYFSWASQMFSPGPVYNWILTAGGTWAGALYGAEWFAWGAWVALTTVVVALITFAWSYLAKGFGRGIATAFVTLLTLWSAVIGPGEWAEHFTFAGVAWMGTLNPPLVTVTLAATLAAVRGRVGVTHVVFWTGVLAQVHTTMAVFAAALLLLTLWKTHISRGVLTAVLFGWWWLPLRLAGEGFRAFLPGDDATVIQGGPFPERPTISLRWAADTIQDHTLLPWWAAVVVTIVGLGLYLRNRSLRDRETLLVGLVVVYAWVMMVALFPQQYTGYQSAWVEPAFILAVVLAVVRVAAKFRTGIPALLRRAGHGVGIVTALLVLVLQVHGTDPQAAVDTPRGSLPVPPLEATVTAARGESLPVVLALGPGPERHATAIMYLEARGVQVCSADGARPAGNPLNRMACDSSQLAAPAIWLRVGIGSAPLRTAEQLQAWDDTFQFARGWELLLLR